MLSRKIKILSNSLVRGINTTQCCWKVSTKQVNMMKKMMVGREKGKRRFVYEEYPKMVTAEKLSNPARQGKDANRRVTVLNKLFMKNITDLMATGDFADKLFGYGIQISTVQVAADFKKLNIYWFTRSTEKDEEIVKVLKSIAGPLRHELSVLRLMGEIPQINFCRDASLAKSSIIDARLQMADFGEDFVPTDPTLFMKPQIKLEMKLPDHLRQKIRELDSSCNEEEEDEEDFPEMRHDIFGLDHHKIMGSVVANINKTSKAWELYNNEDNSDVMRAQLIENMKIDNDKLAKDAVNRDEFIKFLEKKKIEKKMTPERKKGAKLVIVNDDDSNLEVDLDPIPDNDVFIEEDFIHRKL